MSSRSRARAQATPPKVTLPTDLARLPPQKPFGDRRRLAAFVALSPALHGSLFALVMGGAATARQHRVEVISVEIELGASAPAGIVRPTPGEQQEQSTKAPDRQSTELQQTEPKAIRTAADGRSRQTGDSAATHDRSACRRREPKPSVAMVESPQADTATATPRETPPDAQNYRFFRSRRKSRPRRSRRRKPVKDAAPAKEPRRIAAPTREKSHKEAKASTPSSQANNVGIGRSANDTNYPGLVSAHLRRHQQYPADARSRGDQGTATVSFSLDGGGRVTSARLARSSGISSIDGEVTAMVRRASPFPAAALRGAA